MRRLTAIIFLLGAAACGGPGPADLIITGQVWTGDREQERAEAVAIAGDSILAVGDSATILARYQGPRTRRLDNGSGTVMPGFMDDHTHFIDGGYQLAGVDLRDAATPAEFIARIRDYAATLQPGEWITGGDWDHERWPGTPLPRADWIDSVSGDHPVFVSRLDGHMGVANSTALRLAGITAATPNPPGGTIVRDRRTGRPTGVLKDAASNPVWAVVPAPSAAQQDSALARAMRHAAEHGVTLVSHVSAGWSDLAAWRRARDQGRLRTRAVLYLSLSRWQAVADTIERSGAGDGLVRIGGMKGFVDGSLGSTTAWFFEPYLDAPGETGLIQTPEPELRALVGAADAAGLQLAIHAIGDRANATLLDIYDSVAKAHGKRDRRFRIEHAQHLRPEDIPRFARLGVIASVQPYHAIDDGRWAEKRIGPVRIRTTYPFRSLLDAGAHVAFGSDWTVAPLDPLQGVYAAVTRRTLDGKHPDGWMPEQKVTLEDALHAYTYENAYAVFRETDLGMLREGYKADVVLLDHDLFNTAAEDLGMVRPRVTVMGGTVVYERP